jgi:hypothetical protein
MILFAIIFSGKDKSDKYFAQANARIEMIAHSYREEHKHKNKAAKNTKTKNFSLTSVKGFETFAVK